MANKEISRLTDEERKLADECWTAIRCADEYAHRIGEECGYPPPPFWMEARAWVRENLIPTQKMYNDSHSSYGLKHMLEKDTHIYLTNSQFKMLMIECGYLPKNPRSKNWIFRISRRSPAFRKER